MLMWIIGTAAVGILVGAILTLWVEWHIFSQPVRSRLDTDEDDDPLIRADTVNPIELPEVFVTIINHFYRLCTKCFPLFTTVAT